MEIQKQEFKEVIINLRHALEISNKALQDTEAIASALQEENQIMKPKAELYDQAMDCNNLIDLSQAAKILNYPNVGRNILKQTLRNMGILIKNDTPRSDLIQRKIMDVKMKPNPRLNKVFPVPFFTPKGLDFIRRELDGYFSNSTN